MHFYVQRETAQGLLSRALFAVQQTAKCLAWNTEGQNFVHLISSSNAIAQESMKSPYAVEIRGQTTGTSEALNAIVYYAEADTMVGSQCEWRKEGMKVGTTKEFTAARACGYCWPNTQHVHYMQ